MRKSILVQHSRSFATVSVLAATQRQVIGYGTSQVQSRTVQGYAEPVEVELASLTILPGG